MGSVAEHGGFIWIALVGGFMIPVSVDRAARSGFVGNATLKNSTLVSTLAGLRLRLELWTAKMCFCKLGFVHAYYMAKCRTALELAHDVSGGT